MRRPAQAVDAGAVQRERVDLRPGAGGRFAVQQDGAGVGGGGEDGAVGRVGELEGEDGGVVAGEGGAGRLRIIGGDVEDADGAVGGGGGEAAAVVVEDGVVLGRGC